MPIFRAVPVEGTADIGRDGVVDIRLKGSLGAFQSQDRAASRAAEVLEPVVPHYLNITQQYNRPKSSDGGQKFYTWAGKGKTPDPSRLGRYDIPTGNSNVIADLSEHQGDIKDVASYIANRKAYPSYDEEDTKPTQYKMRTRRRKADGAAPEETPAKNQPAADSVEKLYEPVAIKYLAPKPPVFEHGIRSHTIWENMTVKFTCRVDGRPTPSVTWYHNMIPIQPELHPAGKYKITERNGINTLEVSRCQIADAGTYRVSVQNFKGELSSYATLVVKRYDSGRYGYYDIKSGYNIKKPTDYPDVQELNVPGYPRFATKLYNQSVWEGDAITFACHVEGKPPPNVFWTLNGKSIETEPDRVRVSFDGIKATVSILRAFTDYEGEWCCRAYNSCGAAVSKMFLYVRGRHGPPSAPTNLDVVETTRDHIMLTWKRPGYIGHFGGAEVDGYIIEYAAAGSALWTQLSTKLISLMRYPVTGLEEGTAYFFRVKSVNRWGKSQWCKAIGPVACRDTGAPRCAAEIAEDKFSMMPPEAGDIQVYEEEEPAVPEIPENVRVHSTTLDGTICVAFDAVEGEVDGYFVEYALAKKNEWSTFNSAPIKVAGEPYPISGLELGKQFQFRVRAKNHYGFSESSLPTEIVWCGEPQEIENEEEDEENEECASDEAQVISGDAPKCYSVCTDGTDFEGRYRGPPTPPRSVNWAKATREYVEVTWAPPGKSGGEQVAYYLEKQKLGSGVWEFCNEKAISMNHYIVNELEMGEKYIFRVRAVNSKGSSGFSEPSEPVIAYDGIRPPAWYGNALSFFRVSRFDGKPDVTKTSVKVSWDEPQRDGGAPIIGYYLEVREYGGKWKQVNNKAFTQRHFTVDGLTPQRYYQFRVKAANIVGCGAYINLPGRVFTDDPAAPGPADWLEFTGIGEDWVELKWEASKDLGDGDFKGYVVEKCKEGTDLWIPVNSPEMAADCKYKVNGLVPGQTYFFRVRGVSTVGEGVPSNPSCYATPGVDTLQDLIDRQNAMYAERRRLEELERQRLRDLEELERQQPFLREIQDQWMNTGDRAFFLCEVKDQTTEVDWFLGNWKETKIEPTGKFHIISAGRVRMLIIDNVNNEDPCIVHCVCRYNGFCSTADLCVDGIAPVRFIKYFGDTFANKGDTVVLHCNLSKHCAVVKWKKITAQGEVEITEEDIKDGKYEVVSQGGARSLIIHDIQYEDIAQVKFMIRSFTNIRIVLLRRFRRRSHRERLRRRHGSSLLRQIHRGRDRCSIHC